MQTPAQVAKRANVHVNSIRNWSVDYADLLSPQARGEEGARLFTDEDVQTILAIAALRKSGVPPSEISGRIRQHEVPPVVDVATETLQSSPQEAHNALQTTSNAISPLQVAHNALQSHQEATDKRIDMLERTLILMQQSESNRNSSLITGIVIGGAITLIVVALALGMRP